MRILNRPLALLLAVALGVAALFVVVQVVALAVGAGPVLVDWTAWTRKADTTTWNSTVVLTVSIVLIVVGGVLLLAELKPARSSRVPLRSDDAATDAAITRRGLAAAARGAAADVDGIGRATAAAGRRTVTVTARSRGTDKAAAADLQQPVTEAVTTALAGLGLSRVPRVKVTVGPKGQ